MAVVDAEDVDALVVIDIGHRDLGQCPAGVVTLGEKPVPACAVGPVRTCLRGPAMRSRRRGPRLADRCSVRSEPSVCRRRWETSHSREVLNSGPWQSATVTVASLSHQRVGCSTPVQGPTVS